MMVWQLNGECGLYFDKKGLEKGAKGSCMINLFWKKVNTELFYESKNSEDDHNLQTGKSRYFYVMDRMRAGNSFDALKNEKNIPHAAIFF